MQAVILFLCILTVVVVPFIVSFESRLKPTGWLLLLDIVLALIEVFFLVDVFMNFRIAYFCPVAAQFVNSRHEIALRYARGMLITDLLSSIPVTIVWRFCMDGRHVKDGVVGTFAMLQYAAGPAFFLCVLGLGSSFLGDLFLQSNF